MDASVPCFWRCGMDKRFEGSSLDRQLPCEWQHGADATVLLVCDDQQDIAIVRKALSEAPLRLCVKVCANGPGAQDVLRRCLDDQARTLPDLILLDLQRADAGAFEFLKQVKDAPDLRAIPVCTLTNGDDDLGREAYAAGANAVVSKVGTLEAMGQILNAIVEFWFKTAKRYYV
ncbi:hypothetical protein CH339_19365 [Rhodobium orientis]|uniref:Response regulatory domain-containing protein n=2 Tax=Rhodobium orientis TaxID=34017 RepID=A0A327JFL1_9HYPH|nr:hypothetical protein CH339_19365 [Rhodobium orientis]